MNKSWIWVVVVVSFIGLAIYTNSDEVNHFYNELLYAEINASFNPRPDSRVLIKMEGEDSFFVRAGDIKLIATGTTEGGNPYVSGNKRVNRNGTFFYDIEIDFAAPDELNNWKDAFFKNEEIILFPPLPRNPGD